MSPIRRMSRRRAAIVAFTATLILALPMVVLASHQFDDVPTDHPFHNDIDALADAGITGGCSADNYCPGSFVTRGQMAAFLNRLGALAPGKTPKVNADKVDGITSVDLMPGGNPPAGMTIRGTFAMSGTGLTWAAYSFGYELSSAPTPHFLPAGSAATADCPGSSSNPEAAFGHLCVYEDADNVSGSADFDCLFAGHSGTCGTAGREGFGISQFDEAAWLSAGSWAVTEPLVIILPLAEQEGDGRSPMSPNE